MKIRLLPLLALSLFLLQPISGCQSNTKEVTNYDPDTTLGPNEITPSDAEVLDNDKQISDPWVTAESDILKLYDVYVSTDIESADYDPVKFEFEEALKQLLLDPKSKDYQFSGLSEAGIHAVQSTDKKMRVFSWDDNTGGSMRFYTNLYQVFDGTKPEVYLFRASQDTKAQETTHINEIHSFQADNKTYYVLLGQSPVSNRLVYELLQMVTLNGNRMHFKNNNILWEGKKVSTIFTSYDVLNLDQDTEEELVNLIKFDAVKRQINVPVVNSEDQFTKKHKTLHLVGNLFK